MVFYIFAVDSEPKMVMCRTVVENGRYNMYGKWYKKGGDKALTSLRIYDSDGTHSTPLADGSEIRVWGFD